MPEMGSKPRLPTPEQILLAQGFNFVMPVLLTPGGLAIVSHASTSEKFVAFLAQKEKRLWYVRGYLGHDASFPPCLDAQPPRLLTKTANHIYVSILGSRVSSPPLSFEPIGDDKGEIVAFGFYVEAENPTHALEDAREPFGELLDEITAHTGAPLRYSQYSVAESPETQPLAFEVHVPFLTQLSFDQGMFLPTLHSLFTVPNALIREGLCSESPYYRLLCAYRLQGAIEWIRGQVGKEAAGLGKGKLLPKLPVIAAGEILERGAELGRTSEEKEKVKTDKVFNLIELFEFWTNKRNAVAHFLVTREKPARLLVPSIGKDYRDFASSAAILLYYSHAALNDLRLFVAQHLQPEPPYQIVHTPIGQDPRYLGALLMSPENPKRGG